MHAPLTAAILCLTASPALAELTFCNETEARASVAIGYSDDGVWISEGWWHVDAGACRVVVKGDLPRRYYYWRATTPAGAFAGGAYSFCTDGEPFTIEGDTECEGRGYDTATFREEDIGSALAHTVALTPADAPRDTARKTPARNEARKAAPAAPAIPVDAGPGTFGEPLSITGSFRGCWATDEERTCMFDANGWVYSASETGPTPQAIIDALEMRDEYDEISISGDLISYADSRAEIMIRSFEVVLPVAQPRTVSMEGLMDHLQGVWESDSGDGSGWMIEGNRLRVIHDANIAEEYFFQIHPDCAASEGQGPVIIGWPEIDPSMGPACFLVTETAQRHLAVRDMVEGWSMSFSYGR